MKDSKNQEKLQRIQGKESFFDGFPSHLSFASNIRINSLDRIWLFLTTSLITLYKLFTNSFGQHDKFEEQIDQGLQQHRNHTLTTRGRDVDRSDEFYLTDAEISQFEQQGILGPFDVLSPEQAQDLANFSNQKHADGSFSKEGIFDDEIVSIMQASEEWNLDYSGLYQALKYKNMWDVLSAPQISHRLASLLGNDVVCWRSQFFEKKPGAIGTFWHQNSVFRETGDNDKLTAPDGVDPGMIQLTAWIALTDVTKENGAMRMIPGSFANSTTEFFYSFIQDHKMRYLSTMERKEMKNLMKLLFYSTGAFQKAQAVFDSFYNRIGADFKDKTIVDLEMKAGQAVIFSSLNMHASYSNSTIDQTRLAFAGRYCNNDVKIFNNMSHGTLTTSAGPKKYDLSKLAAMQIHGQDHWHHSNIATAVQVPQGHPSGTGHALPRSK